MAALLAVAHLAIAAVWLGSMTYSLTVVQPRVNRFFPDEVRREEFLITLAHGNRWKVVGLIGALALSAVGVMLTGPRPAAVGYGAVLALYAVAAGIFWHVSWQHWPARVFATPTELPGYRHRLRALAWAMLLLVAAAFLIALGVATGLR